MGYKKKKSDPYKDNKDIVDRKRERMNKKNRKQNKGGKITLNSED